jgi:hypothetical protein
MKRISTDDVQLMHRLVTRGFTEAIVSKLLGCSLTTVLRNRKVRAEDPDWFPTIEYLQRLGLQVDHDNSSNLLRLEHPEGVSFVPFELRTLNSPDIRRERKDGKIEH